MSSVHPSQSDQDQKTGVSTSGEMADVVAASATTPSAAADTASAAPAIVAASASADTASGTSETDTTSNAAAMDYDTDVESGKEGDTDWNEIVFTAEPKSRQVSSKYPSAITAAAGAKDAASETKAAESDQVKSAAKDAPVTALSGAEAVTGAGAESRAALSGEAQSEACNQGGQGNNSLSGIIEEEGEVNFQDLEKEAEQSLNHSFKAKEWNSSSSFSYRKGVYRNRGTVPHKARTLTQRILWMLLPLALLWLVIGCFTYREMSSLARDSSLLHIDAIPVAFESERLKRDMVRVAYHVDLIAQSMNVALAYSNYVSLKVLLEEIRSYAPEPIKSDLLELSNYIEVMYNAKKELHYRTKQIFNTWLTFYGAVQNFCILTGQIGAIHEIALHDHSIIMHGYSSLEKVVGLHASSLNNYVEPQCGQVFAYYRELPPERQDISRYAHDMNGTLGFDIHSPEAAAANSVTATAVIGRHTGRNQVVGEEDWRQIPNDDKWITIDSEISRDIATNSPLGPSEPNAGVVAAGASALVNAVTGATAFSEVPQSESVVSDNKAAEKTENLNEPVTGANKPLNKKDLNEAMRGLLTRNEAEENDSVDSIRLDVPERVEIQDRVFSAHQNMDSPDFYHPEQYVFKQEHSSDASAGTAASGTDGALASAADRVTAVKAATDMSGAVDGARTSGESASLMPQKQISNHDIYLSQVVDSTEMSRNEKFLFTCRAYTKSYRDLTAIRAEQKQAKIRFNEVYSGMLQIMSSINQEIGFMDKAPVVTVASDLQQSSARMVLISVIAAIAVLVSLGYSYICLYYYFKLPVQRLVDIMGEFRDTCRVPDPREVSLRECQQVVQTLRPIMEEYRDNKQSIQFNTTFDSGYNVGSLASRYYVDGLTHLHNRASLMALIDKSPELPVNTVLMVVDIDNFTRFNEAEGEKSGDAVLRVFGRVLKGVMPERAQIFRYSGEEFVIIIPDISYRSVVRLGATLQQIVEDLSISYSSDHTGNTAQIASIVDSDSASAAASAAGSRAVCTENSDEAHTGGSQKTKRSVLSRMVDLSQRLMPLNKEHITVSIGISYCDGHTAEGSLLLNEHLDCAHEALSFAKKEGYGHIYSYESVIGPQPVASQSEDYKSVEPLVVDKPTTAEYAAASKAVETQASGLGKTSQKHPSGRSGVSCKGEAIEPDSIVAHSSYGSNSNPAVVIGGKTIKDDIADLTAHAGKDGEAVSYNDTASALASAYSSDNGAAYDNAATSDYARPFGLQQDCQHGQQKESELEQADSRTTDRQGHHADRKVLEHTSGGFAYRVYSSSEEDYQYQSHRNS